MFEAIIFVSILFVFLTTFIFWCCEKKRDLDTRIIGGAFITYCFISVFAQMYLLPILEIIDWDKRISLQMQLTALAVGVTAAIIAFRNYQRKSGVELLANYESNWDSLYGSKVTNVTISNLKDRKVQILEIYLLLDGELPLLLSSYKDKPIILDGYVTETILIPPPTNYVMNNSVLYLDSFFQYEKNQLLIVTPEKIFSPKWLSKPTSNELLGNIIFSYRNEFTKADGDKRVFPFTFGYVITISFKYEIFYMYIVMDKNNNIINLMFLNEKFEGLKPMGARGKHLLDDLKGVMVHDMNMLYKLIFDESHQYFHDDFYLQKDKQVDMTYFNHERNLNAMLTFKHGYEFKVLSSLDKDNPTGEIKFERLNE